MKHLWDQFLHSDDMGKRITAAIVSGGIVTAAHGWPADAASWAAIVVPMVAAFSSGKRETIGKLPK
jgi:hypothetical protein